jgi:hypothetical protein
MMDAERLRAIRIAVEMSEYACVPVVLNTRDAAALLEEVERLRAALESIRNMTGCEMTPPGWGDEYQTSKLNRINALAYEALKEGGDP